MKLIENPPPEPRANTTGHKPGETLLVVEDEPVVRELACEFLRAEGYHVLEAADGQEGLNVFREHQGAPVALVVTDVIMPQMDGNVMVEWLCCSQPDLKVLYTSGYSEEAIAHRGVLSPGVAFLPKPYSPGKLCEKVRGMLAEAPDASVS